CLLDERLQPVLPGATGELCLGGGGVGRGYFARPGRAAGGFVPRPSPPPPGGGPCPPRGPRRPPAGRAPQFPRAPRRPGNVRGSRRGVGEVETALLSLPGVREATAAVHAGPGGSRLIAYLVPEAAAKPPSGELRRVLKDQVPEHMVPSLFVWLEAIPRSAT